MSVVTIVVYLLLRNVYFISENKKNVFLFLANSSVSGNTCLLLEIMDQLLLLYERNKMYRQLQEIKYYSTAAAKLQPHPNIDFSSPPVTLLKTGTLAVLPVSVPHVFIFYQSRPFLLKILNLKISKLSVADNSIAKRVKT